MKRSIIILPIAILIIAVAAVVAIADSGGGSSGSKSSSASTGSSSGGGGIYGSPVAPASSAPAAKPKAGARTAIATATAGHGVGTMLVDGRGRTLYLWKADTGSMSTCSGECARDWPPLTTKASVKPGGSVNAKLLGTTRRSDGTTQVTYAGHPLYLFAGDTAAGQLNGQGSQAFGAAWWAVAPNGHAITKTAA